MRRAFSLASLGLAALCTAPALFGGEYAVLASGLRLRVERHEVVEGTVRLYANGGVTEIPAAAVRAFEVDDYVPAPAAPVPASAASAKPADPKALIHDAAVRSGLPPKFVESVAKVESGLNPAAVSSKGAIGVMQLMPETAKTLHADPSDPEQNIEAGARLLRELLLRYNGDVVKALAAYNAGPGAVDRYNGLPPFAETQQYVNKVIRTYQSPDGSH